MFLTPTPGSKGQREAQPPPLPAPGQLLFIQGEWRESNLCPPPPTTEGGYTFLVKGTWRQGLTLGVGCSVRVQDPPQGARVPLRPRLTHS